MDWNDADQNLEMLVVTIPSPHAWQEFGFLPGEHDENLVFLYASLKFAFRWQIQDSGSLMMSKGS